eukprot:CAMPEP_0181232930 /NCGR_PEP_ID=MMETSP1096-20121128/36032_1 /TAXON_ID=156174 ORGANISM="Chrysochromulina ericina, Strain CCMP281" /NCGR_SAMPLE_ID=MMETSP1096 /ASSEMBLY_ACC=CAM_ASM_000453 /LENGTH=153 /DNA_ID=CAMNT_0023327331 /DNA_START=74 /DNA_END=538 /DNA_ORIENTATION=+
MDRSMDRSGRPRSSSGRRLCTSPHYPHTEPGATTSGGSSHEMRQGIALSRNASVPASGLLATRAMLTSLKSGGARPLESKLRWLFILYGELTLRNMRQQRRAVGVLPPSRLRTNNPRVCGSGDPRGILNSGDCSLHTQPPAQRSLKSPMRGPR